MYCVSFSNFVHMSYYAHLVCRLGTKASSPILSRTQGHESFRLESQIDVKDSTTRSKEGDSRPRRPTLLPDISALDAVRKANGRDKSLVCSSPSHPIAAKIHGKRLPQPRPQDHLLYRLNPPLPDGHNGFFVMIVIIVGQNTLSKDTPNKKGFKTGRPGKLLSQSKPNPICT